MRNLDLYYLIVQVVGLLLWFGLGLTRLPNSRLNGWAAGLGFLTNLAVQLPEGGPGLCLGSVMFPILAIGLAWAGRGTRLALVRVGVIKPRLNEEPVGPRCGQCGYSLIGLTEKRCPECGRPFE